MKKGFTLVEMLIVIGIIAILLAASLASFSKMSKTADKTRAQEAVDNARTALTALYQAKGMWPKRIRDGASSERRLNERVAYVLSNQGYLTLATGNDKTLVGKDQFGLLTPWAEKLVKHLGTRASLSTKVTGTSTVEDHILYYAIDYDGDGIIENVDVGGEAIDIRATAAVWSIGKSGGNGGKPWPYSEGRKKDDVYSWTIGQTREVR